MHFLPRMNIMLDFICMGSVELSCEERETSEIIKIKKKYPSGIEPASPCFPTGRLQPLGQRDRCFVMLKSLAENHHTLYNVMLSNLL